MCCGGVYNNTKDSQDAGIKGSSLWRFESSRQSHGLSLGAMWPQTDRIVRCGKSHNKYNRKSQETNGSALLIFDAILSTAVRTKCPQADLPKALVIISDLEIDYWDGGSLTFTEEMRKRFAEAGYEMPKLVYWNVDSRKDTFLASKNDQNAILVSGQSASTFKNLIKGIDLSAYEIMVETLNDPRYDCVVVPSQL